MVTSLNNDVPVGDIGYGLIQTVTKAVTFADTTQFNIVGLPAHATILEGQLTVTSAFDNTSTLLSVGYTDSSASNASAYASSLAMITAGTSVAFDDVLTAGAKPRTVKTTVIGKFHGTNSTTGSGNITIRFVTRHPAP